jgi:predicted dehydrogenase
VTNEARPDTTPPGAQPATGLSPAASASADRSHVRPARRCVAIVGTGMIAAVHRRSALLAGAEIVGVLGSSPSRSAQVAADWDVRTAYSDIDDVLAGPADIVHVCSPNATHAAYVEALVAAGKHVICEKPLGVSLVEAERMNDAATKAGVVATVPFVYRYHPIVREIRARAQAGEFGEWNLLHGHYLQDWLLSPGASNWRVDPAQGGRSRAFADIGSHWCDLVEWVSGQGLDTVSAQLAIAVPQRAATATATFEHHTDGPQQSVATEDSAVVMFRTTAGVPGSIVVSQVAAGRKNRLWFELDGSAGSAVFDQENPESFWWGTEAGSRQVVRDPQSGSPEQRRLSYLPAGHPQGYADCFAAFVADTYAAIDGDKRDGLPTFSDGVRAARIVDAVVRSSDTSTWTEV